MSLYLFNSLPPFHHSSQLYSLSLSLTSLLLSLSPSPLYSSPSLPSPTPFSLPPSLPSISFTSLLFHVPTSPLSLPFPPFPLLTLAHA